MEQQTQRQKTKRRTSARIRIKTKDRPSLILDKQYNRLEAALVTGVSYITIVRAQEKGELAAYKIGRRILHSGKHLHDWLKSKEVGNA